MKKVIMFLVLILAAIPLSARTDVLPGDVDDDGKVGIADVTALIDYLLSGNSVVLDMDAADVDGDGNVSIADVTELIDFILQPKDHEWVDLGLPSGTLWATMNVGADTPADYGDYFAWGETAPKDVYSWGTYKWSNGQYNTLTKYCTNSEYGLVDNKTELEPEDDAAYVNWGSSWRMPTKEQQDELRNYCSHQWTMYMGVNGTLLTGPNGNNLFLPAAGGRYYLNPYLENSYGLYWSRTLYSSIPSCVYRLYFYSDGVYWEYYGHYRPDGMSVRAVRVKQN